MHLALALLAVLPAAEAANSPGLEARLAPLAKAHKGKVALAVRHLGTGECYYLNADEVMPTASLIKVAVLVEAYQQAAEGKVRLTDRVTLREADKVPGSGILTYHFSDGATFALRDAVRLMIAFSDNTATNLVLDKVGIGAVNDRMAAWGYPNTRINAKVFRGSTTSVAPERTKKYGLGSTTAREMSGLFAQLQLGERFPPAVKQAVLGHLRKNEDRDKFPKLLPPGTVLLHKDGAVNDARTDAGILYTPTGPVALCVLTNGNEDQEWRPDNAGNVLCAKVAKAVYDHFAAPAAARSAAK
jgi:beta-lactamase class A